MEEEIIQPIDRELLKSELTPEKQLRMTNKSHNEIYIVTANDSPNVLKRLVDFVKSLSAKREAERANLWILMSSTLVTTVTSS